MMISLLLFYETKANIFDYAQILELRIVQDRMNIKDSSLYL